MATQETPQRCVRVFLKRPAKNPQSSNESAKILRIVREHYVRSSVHCGLSNCNCTLLASPSLTPKLLGHPLRLEFGLKLQINLNSFVPCVIMPDVEFVIQQVCFYICNTPSFSFLFLHYNFKIILLYIKF